MPAAPIKKSLLYLTPIRCLFLGEMPIETRVCQASPALMFSLNGHFRVHLEANEHECRSLLIPAGKECHIELSEGFGANIILSRLDLDFNVLAKHMAHEIDGIYFDFSEEQAFIPALKAIYQHEYEVQSVFELLMSKLKHLDCQHPSYGGIDERIRAIVHFLRAHPTENVPLETLARMVSVSESRLIQLFKQEMGVPIRRYRLWLRCFEAVLRIAANQSSTHAAIAAGFTDAPHFCKTFKEFFGLSPMKVMGKESRLIIKQLKSRTPFGVE